jgi:DUF4097 and DUF4098 domain-containing protein YvlB
MATFDTPEPISVRVDISTGDILIVASDRPDTVVEVRPTDGSSAADVKAADQARVEYARGKLLVKAATQLRHRSALSNRGGSVDVTIELPAGSHMRGGSAWATLRSEGRLGECRFETVHSDIRLDETGPLRLTVSRGEITVARVTGQVKIANGSGSVRIDAVHGTAVVGNDHGDIRIGEITGNLRMTGMDGDFHVEQAHGSVEAKTVHGSVRIGEVTRGTVAITAASAEIEIGIRAGTAAKLDVSTVSGSVHNDLVGVDGPEESDEIVEVRARTFSGDVVIHRS